MVMAAKLGTVVVLDCWCEPVGWGPLVVLRLGVIVLSVQWNLS